MKVFTPDMVSKYTTTTAGDGPEESKYLGVLVAAKYARLLNEGPSESSVDDPKLTTQALEMLTTGKLEFDLTTRRPDGGL